jgi:hypothetical protein
MELARGVVPLVLGIVLIVVSVLVVSTILFPLVPALAFVAILFLVRGIRELRVPPPDRRHRGRRT